LDFYHSTVYCKISFWKFSIFGHISINIRPKFMLDPPKCAEILPLQYSIKHCIVFI
jgi:hypothetical protein